MRLLSKFRTWGGKIVLMAEYAYLIDKRLKRLGISMGIDVVHENLRMTSADLDREKEHLIEVYVDDSGDLMIERKDVWPENEDSVKNGRKLELNEDNKSNLFWVRDNYLYVFEGEILDLLAIYCEKYLTQKLPLKEVAADQFNNVQEAFIINSEQGVVSLNSIDSHEVGNSRFFANWLRKHLADIDS